MSDVTHNQRMRLDTFLVEHGHFESRSRARDAILRGTVHVDGEIVHKASANISSTSTISVDDPAQHYVSRAALKLVAALDVSKININGRTCLDIGASTGGFTQVLLEHGAQRVFAIDVGHDQLHPSLRDDPRVVVLEGLNARELQSSDVGNIAPEIIVSDVSFISLKLAMPPALSFAAPGAHCVLLVKPQFEVGRENIGKGGLVKLELAAKAGEDLRNWLNNQEGWRSTELIPSPIKGGDGNTEFLLTGQKDG